MKKLTIIMQALLFAHLACAQDARADFKKINAAYSNATSLSMQVSYALFFDHEQKPGDTENGLYKKDGLQYYVRQADKEILVNASHVVLIDRDTKTMVLDKAGSSTSKPDPLQLDPDSLFRNYEKVEFYKTGAGHAYHFVLKAGPYSSIDVVFDPASFFVKEIVSVYREPMPDAKEVRRKVTLKTRFSNITTKPVFTKEFSTATYVSSHKNGLRPAAAYSGYKLLTNLKKLGA